MKIPGPVPTFTFLCVLLSVAIFFAFLRLGGVL